VAGCIKWEKGAQKEAGSERTSLFDLQAYSIVNDPIIRT
jgi:hypothetical protein